MIFKVVEIKEYILKHKFISLETYIHGRKKLIKFGKSAFCMILPHAWIEENRIKKGDLLSVHETLRNSLDLYGLTIYSNKLKHLNNPSILYY